MSTTAAEPRYADEVDGLGDFPIREGLHWKEKKEVRELLTISRGVMLVYGDPGGGKDLFGTSFCAREKYFFNRRILLDFLPTRAFDEIDGGGKYVLFNAQVMMREINKMAKLAGVEGIGQSADVKERDEFVGEATRKWALEGEGETLLQGAVLYLSELKRYCYNRLPHNPFNRFIGSINSVWRHLDLLVIGTHVLPHEIDKYTYLSYAKIRAKCSWCVSRPYTSQVTISRGAFAEANNVFMVEGRPLTIYVDGNEQREWLNGKKFFDLYLTKNKVNLKPVVRKEMIGG